MAKVVIKIIVMMIA